MPSSSSPTVGRRRRTRRGGLVEPAGFAAPLALVGAVAQAQAVVARVARAAVLGLGEQAGGRPGSSRRTAELLCRAGGAGTGRPPTPAPRPARPRRQYARRRRPVPVSAVDAQQPGGRRRVEPADLDDQFLADHGDGDRHPRRPSPSSPSYTLLPTVVPLLLVSGAARCPGHGRVAGAGWCRAGRARTSVRGAADPGPAGARRRRAGLRRW